MINEDILIKFSRKNNNLFKRNDLDWVERAIMLRDQIRFIRDWDFKGLGTDDLNLIEPDKVREGSRIILPGNSIEATILGIVLRKNNSFIELEIEALGCGTDYKRDPDRKLRYGTKIYPDLNNYEFILEVISVAKVAAGPTYYFFSKSVRDNRENIIKNDPELSRRLILGSLYSNLCGPDDRIRAQHMHYLRRIEKELSFVMKKLRLPEDDIILRLYDAYPDENKMKKLLYERLETSSAN